MVHMVLVLSIVFFPSLAFAGSGCEIASVTFHNTEPCADVEIKNISGGSKTGGTITVKLMDGKSKTESFQSDKKIENGQLYTTKVCWDKKSDFDDVDCDL